MPTEAGDTKLIGNFRRLIDLLAGETNYNPANPALAVTALETQYDAAKAGVEAVSNKLAPSKIAINNRQIAFEGLSPLVIRSRNVLKASGASKEVLADAETSVRKLTGVRKSKVIKDDPNTPANEADNQHSASQMGFDNRLGNLSAYVAILNNVPEYAPNETDLKISALNTLITSLQAKNDAVSTTFVPLSQSRGTRDELLYLNEDSVVNTALLAKAYVAGALGTSSNVYKQIKGLAFRRRE